MQPWFVAVDGSVQAPALVRAIWPVWRLLRTRWLAGLERQMSPCDLRRAEIIVERRLLELTCS